MTFCFWTCIVIASSVFYEAQASDSPIRYMCVILELMDKNLAKKDRLFVDNHAFALRELVCHRETECLSRVPEDVGYTLIEHKF